MRILQNHWPHGHIGKKEELVRYATCAHSLRLVDDATAAIGKFTQAQHVSVT